MSNLFNFNAVMELLQNSDVYYIICTDNTGNYSYINNRYARAFSHIHPNLVGQPYYITMHPDDMKVCEEVGGKCYAYPGKLFPAIIRKHNGQGGYITTRWEFTLMEEDGQPAGVFCLGYDITEYEKVKDEYVNVNKSLEVKNGLLEVIAYEQSHIARAPLANIIGLVDILKRMEHSPDVTVIINMLEESSNSLDDAIKGIVKKTYL